MCTKSLFCRKGNDIRGFTVLLEIMMTVCSNTAVCECGFSCMNRKKSVLRTRLGKYTLNEIMRINIGGPSSDNFDTEKFISDWIESTVTSRHLNGHNSCRIETHEEAGEKRFVLKSQNKIKTLLDYLVCIYCFFLTFIM